MAGIRDLKGLGSGNARVQLVPNTNPIKANLTAQEGFVLSRIDGKSTLETICFVSGLGVETTANILRRLHDLNLIRIEGEDSSNLRKSRLTSPINHFTHKTPPSKNTPPMPYRSTVESSVTSIKNNPAPSNFSTNRLEKTPPPSKTKTAEGPMLATSNTTASIGSPPASSLPDDEPGIDLKPEIRASIRTLYGKLGTYNFFQLLDTDPYADSSTLRRAYFKRSKEFHPDRYFSKNLGNYKEMLQEIFKQISAAFKFLEDEEKRKEYRQMILQEMEQESLVREVEKQGAEVLKEVEQEKAQTHPAQPTDNQAGSEYHYNRHNLKRSGSPSEERLNLRVVPRRTRRDTASFTPLPIHPAPETNEEQEKRRDEDQRRRRKLITSSLISHFQRARKFYEQGIQQQAANQILAAAASLKLAVTLHPEEETYRQAYEEALEKSKALTAESHFKRGLFEESVGRLESARSLFVSAADLVPKFDYLKKAAEHLLTVEDLIKARDYAIKAVQCEPNSTEGHVILARVYIRAGMAKNARRELQLAYKLDPGNSLVKELFKSLRDL